MWEKINFYFTDVWAKFMWRLYTQCLLYKWRFQEAQAIGALRKGALSYYEGNQAIKVSAATINQSNEVTSCLQLVHGSIQRVGNMLNMLLSIVDLWSHLSIKMCEKSFKPSAHDSCHTLKEGPKDIKQFSQNKGTIFKVAFKRSVCISVNPFEKNKLRLQKAESKIQPLEFSNQHLLQLDGSWRHPLSTSLSYNADWFTRQKNELILKPF